jgi:hypothetical protein
MMSVTSSFTPAMVVKDVVEADRGDGGAGNRRQEGAPQGVAQGVAEARLQGRDGEELAVAFLLGDRFD